MRAPYDQGLERHLQPGRDSTPSPVTSSIPFLVSAASRIFWLLETSGSSSSLY